MKKSNFVALLLGTISWVFFALGMCMTLLPKWNALRPGVIMGSIGLVLALITVFVWRKMEHKEPIKITSKTILSIVVTIVGILGLGVGMCMTMVWNYLVSGIVVGLIGLVMLLMLIPVCKGLK